MKTLLDFSRYINDLIKQKKYENVILMFRDNNGQFSKDEIASNEYLVSNLINAYKQEKKFDNAWQLITDFKIDPLQTGRLVLNSYGWLLHECFKIENKKAEEIQYYIDCTKYVLPLLNLNNNYEKNLFGFLFSDIIRAEKKKQNINANLITEILKSINFKSNEEAQLLISTNDYILPGILDIFRKAGHIDWGESILKFLKFDIGNVSPQILNSYGWLLYSKLKLESKQSEDEDPDIEEKMDSFILESNDVEIGEEFLLNHEQSKTEVFNQICEVISLFPKDGKYSPFSRLFQLVIKTEKMKANSNWRLLLEFIALFEPSALSLDCERLDFIKNGKTKSVELASDRELWYSTKINALYKTNEFLECLETIDKAQKNILKFHYSNDLWFQWKVGLCKKEFGEISEAIKYIEVVYKRKQEWFVQKELADLYLKSGRVNDSLKMAIESALAYGEKEKKDGLYFLMGDILQAKLDYENAYKHYLLGKLIRENQNWAIPKKYHDAINTPLFSQYLIKYYTVKSLYGELTNYWKSQHLQKSTSQVAKFNVLLIGEIVKVKDDEGYGFIKVEDNSSHYFKIKDFKGDRHLLKVGLRVKFELKSSTANKKEQAINIEQASN